MTAVIVSTTEPITIGQMFRRARSRGFTPVIAATGTSTAIIMVNILFKIGLHIYLKIVK
jgi:hypothetical protein